MNCEYCNKSFGTKSSLIYHQKTAKYCLELRGEKKMDIICEHCEQKFSRKSNLVCHYNSCVKKMINESHKPFYSKIEQYKEQLAYLKEEISELKRLNHELAIKAINKPSYITNNELSDNRTINNSNSNNKMIDNRILNMVPMSSLTPEKILKCLEENFTENHLMKGQKGVAEICVEKMLKDKDQKYLLKCTDPSRKIFIYIDEDGKIQKDVNADKLTKMLYEPVKHVTKNIYNELQTNYFDKQNFKSEEDDENMNNEDEERLSYATDKVIEITSLKSNNLEFVRGLIPPLTC
jgi:hypothetical protein